MVGDVDVDVVIPHELDEVVVDETAVRDDSVLGHSRDVLEGFLELLDSIEIEESFPAPVLNPLEVVDSIIVEVLAKLLAEGVEVFLAVEPDFLPLETVGAVPVASTPDHEVYFRIGKGRRHSAFLSLDDVHDDFGKARVEGVVELHPHLFA